MGQQPQCLVFTKELMQSDLVKMLLQGFFQNASSNHPFNFPVKTWPLPSQFFREERYHVPTGSAFCGRDTCTLLRTLLRMSLFLALINKPISPASFGMLPLLWCILGTLVFPLRWPCWTVCYCGRKVHWAGIHDDLLAHLFIFFASSYRRFHISRPEQHQT